MPDEPQVNAVSVNVVIGGLMDDPMQMAISARSADSLMVYWHLMNLTDEAITLTFPGGKLFDLELHRQDTGDQVWKSAEPAAADDVIVTVPRGELFAIPDQDDDVAVRDEVDPDQVPRIELKQILLDLGIGNDVDLYVVFTPACTSYRQHHRVDLWR
jgi:hypothetical protein